jgi:hypothetical protein
MLARWHLSEPGNGIDLATFFSVLAVVAALSSGLYAEPDEHSYEAKTKRTDQSGRDKKRRPAGVAHYSRDAREARRSVWGISVISALTRCKR